MRRVSVIIPNYNHSHYLGNAIQSVLAQTYADFEIIVVDDGSTDKSREVVAAFGKKARYIWQENKGLGGARNTGILASEAEFVGLLDADDAWEPAYLERMIRLTQQHPTAAVYYCRAKGMDENGNDLPQIFGQMGSAGDAYQNLLRANFIIPSTVLMRRSTVVEMGLFEQENRLIHGCEDWDLWLRLAPHYPIIGTEECLVRYRQHLNTFSASPHKMQTAVRAVVEKNFGLDDEQTQSSPADKRRAFGGLYRYHLLTSVQNLGDWDAASQYLKQAIVADPTLSVDLDLFYELAFGKQSAGHRGTSYQLDLGPNADKISEIVDETFEAENQSKTASLWRKMRGTSNFAIGLAAYNSGLKKISRKYLFRSLLHRPELLFEGRVTGNLLKSFFKTS